MRETSFGENSPLSFTDRVGIGLSNRKVINIIKKMPNKPTILDIGCGYNALLLKTLSPSIHQGYGIDISIKDDESFDNLKLIQGPIEQTIGNFATSSIDIILMISVIEHLVDPLLILNRCYTVLNEGGLLIANVPTWRGKKVLEHLAFSWHFSPEDEMNDHKMYYDIRDLWPLLVKVGFKPSDMTLKYHKCGLNLFSVCRKVP
jgi:SAM-dependent methyltransferase